MFKKIALVCLLFSIKVFSSQSEEIIVDGRVVQSNQLNDLNILQHLIIKKLIEERKDKDRQIEKLKRKSKLCCECDYKQNACLCGVCCVSFIFLKCLCG